MSLARLVVTAVKVEGRSKSEVARDYGISRRWVHELVRRYEADGDAGLEPRSRRPHRSPQTTPQPVEDEIVALRKSLSDQGLDAGAATISVHLERAGVTAPAASTIWRILSRRGFVVPHPQRRPKSSCVRFEADQPNERWQADVTHWELADGTGAEILNVVDDCSRLNVAADARRVTPAADVVATFAAAFARHGLPMGVLTDNGAIFTANSRGGGRTALEVELGLLGIKMSHSRPYHPQTCGKVEHLHQTQKKWLAKQPPARSTRELQAQLDRFRDYYNTVRPHRGRGLRRPAQGHPERHRHRPALAGPPRHRRQDRLRHRPAQLTAAPRRTRTPPRRSQDPDAHRRPRHQSHRPRHRTAHPSPDPRPQPRLPAPRTPARTAQESPLTWNDVPRQV